MVVVFLHKHLLGMNVFFSAPLISFVLAPVHAANVCADGDGDGTENGKDSCEDYVADAIVWLTRVIDRSNAREEDVEMCSW